MSFVTAKCYQAKPAGVRREWYHIDATGLVLGRLATRIATVLMGKNKPTYTPHVDTGDFVVVTNASKVRITGRKIEQVEHDYYTYYCGGRKVVPLQRMMERHPDRVIKLAVRRMLPKNSLGRKLLTKLKVFDGPEHPHQAQQPRPLELRLSK
jgi:large subunit ribosomal protein L13